MMMMIEEQILKPPKKNNYYYNIEHINNIECMVVYYKLTNEAWNRHVDYCKDNGFENRFNQWLRILVDVEDFNLIDGWNINMRIRHLERRVSNITPYIAVGIQRLVNKKQTAKSIHRHILNPPKNKQVDHINHNTLDNRKCNLRLVTRSENQQNKNGALSNSKTGIRGVSVITDKRGNGYNYYRAIVVLENKNVFRKLFPFTPQGLIEAEKAVIKARLKYFTHSEMDKIGAK